MGWAVMTMASVAKIAMPMLLAGEPVRTLGLWSFHALVMSHRGEILGFPTEQLVWFPSPSVGAQELIASLSGSPRAAQGQYLDITRWSAGFASECLAKASSARP
jgi:hypothetical protein